MHYTYPLKSSTLGWSHSPYTEKQSSSWSWMERGWGYSIWPGHVESADCSSGSKSAWHWPLGGDTHSLPQRPQTGEETLFGSGQRVSVCWHVSSRVRTHEPTLIQTAADSCVRTPTHTLCPLSPTCTPSTCTPGLSQGWRGARGGRQGRTFPQVSDCHGSKWAAQNNRPAPLTLNPITMFRPQAGTKYDFAVFDIDMSARSYWYKMKNKMLCSFYKCKQIDCYMYYKYIYINIFLHCFLFSSPSVWMSLNKYCCTEHTPWPQLTPQLGSVLWMNETVYITSQNHKNWRCIWLKEL